MRTHRTAAALLTVLAVAVIGCSAGQDNRDGTVQVDDVGASAAASVQPESALPMDGKTAQKYEDGLAVLVSRPQIYRPPAYAAGHSAGNTAVKFKVTIVNGTRAQVDITLTTVSVSFGKDGVQADQVFAEGLGDFISVGKLAAGRRKTVALAFSAPTKDTSIIDVTVTPGFLDHAAALFAGHL